MDKHTSNSGLSFIQEDPAFLHLKVCLCPQELVTEETPKLTSWNRVGWLVIVLELHIILLGVFLKLLKSLKMT